MNSEEEFKQHLRDLVESKEFPFEEREWEKARAIIDRSGRRRWAILFYLSTALLFVGGITIYLLNPSMANGASALTPATSGLHVETGLSSSLQNPSVAETPVPATTEVNKENIARENSSGSQPAVPGKNENAPLTNPRVGETIQETRVKTTGQPAASVSAGGDIQVTAVRKSPEKKNEPEKQATVNELTFRGTVETGHETGMKEKEFAEKPVVEKARTTPMEQVVETPQLKDGVVSSDSAAITSAVDTASALQAARPDTAALDLPLSPSPIMRLSLEAGATYLDGWKANGAKDANGFNPLFGFNYYYPIVNRIVLSAGLQYNSVGDLALYSHTSKTTRYTTGEESRVTVITPQKLHYLVIPLKLNYGLTSNDVVGFGINIAWLADVSSDVETYDLKLNRKENIKTTKAHGYSEGFKTTDTQFSMFYRRKLYKGLYLNGELMVGATDIKDNTFFGSDSREKNYGIKLSVVYSIINR